MKTQWSWVAGLAVISLVALSLRANGAGKPEDTLPAAAADAIKSAYPKAENRGVSVRDDAKYGTKVYAVSLLDTEVKQAMMVRVTEKGVIILAMRQVPDAEVPKAAMEGMQKIAGDGAVKYPRKIEFFVDEKLAKYEKPRVQYEAMLAMKDKTLRNIDVTEDGSLIELTSPIAEADIPKAVMDTMTKAAEGGKVISPSKIETFVDEKMAKLANPRVRYAATLQKDKKFANIEVSQDGKVITQDPW